MTEPKIRVLLADDQALIRAGFALILSTASEDDTACEIVGEAEHGDDALTQISTLAAIGRAPHVVLMDVRMPVMNGIEATRHITKEFPETKVLVLTTFDLDEYVLEAIEAGASGFLLKDARATELISAVRAVAHGDSVMAPSVTRRLISRLRDQTNAAEPVTSGPPPEFERLTEREREVFGLISHGLSNAEIGEQLFLSESTVKTHVGRVLTKLGLRDRVHAVILAYEAGLR
jgi:DNA-binding NarL/FixJ family response regulator